MYFQDLQTVGIFVTCAHLIHLSHLFHVDLSANPCHSLLSSSVWTDDLAFFPPLEILQQSGKNVLIFLPLSYICAQIYMHSLYSFPFTMDKLIVTIQYIFKGGIILFPGHLQLCSLLLICKLFSHFIQILAFLIKKENYLLIPCLCSTTWV